MDRTDSGVDVVILAAGCGRRMGGAEHKALLPVLAGQGTLERLLGQLRALGVTGVTVVTGYKREAVEALVRAQHPQARCVHNPRFEQTEMLASLACAFAAEASGTRDCWVLLADTVYTQEALATLFAAPPGFVAVAATARHGAGGREIPVDVRGDAIIGLAGDAPHGACRMAHAVRWPAPLKARLREAAGAGTRFQWQLIAALLAEATPGHPFPARVIMLPLGAALDMDSPADLDDVRMSAFFPVGEAPALTEHDEFQPATRPRQRS